MTGRRQYDGCVGLVEGPSPATGFRFVTGNNPLPVFHLALTADERHDLLKLAANDQGLFKKIYEATTAPTSSPAYGDYTGYYQLVGTGTNNKWRSPFDYRDAHLLGKHVKVVRGDCEVSRPTCLGQTGVITGWHDFDHSRSSAGFQCILPASCEHMAIVSGDDGQTFYANTSWCDVIGDDSYYTNQDDSVYGTSGIWRKVSPEEMAKYPDRVYYDATGHVKWNVLRQYSNLAITIGRAPGTLVDDCGRSAIDIPWAGPSGSRHYL